MKYKLYNTPNPNLSGFEQVIFNRGITIEEMYHYVNSTDDDISDYKLLGLDNLKNAAGTLIKAIQSNKKSIIIVDSDCDGFTSSSLLYNYLYELFPAWVTNYLEFTLHEGKQHGINDKLNYILENKIKLVICPDSASNDYKAHKTLRESGAEVIVLDHHLADHISADAVIVNNQLSDYPNKDLSGVGVTWQFCRFLDSCLNINNANNYLDLVALGNTGDVMSLLSIETKHLIHKGFKTDNVKNPFILTIWEKNKFKLGEELTSWGAAFYIIPFLNAVCRSGSMEEKIIVFKGMLTQFAFEKVPEIKYNKATGNEVNLVVRSVQICEAVKRKQSKAQEDGMNYLAGMVQRDNLLQHKVLLFLLEGNEVEPNIRGLIASKFMGRYQRPCAILTKVHHETLPWEDGTESYDTYEGSMRGYGKQMNFKDACDKARGTLICQGHENAAGLSIAADKVNEYLADIDEYFKNDDFEICYDVDYIWSANEVNPENILEIAGMNDYWGKDFEESLVAIKGIKVTAEMVTIMKGNTIKITLPNKIPIIKFGGTDEEIEKLTPQQGYVEIDVVAKCNRNEWNGNVSAQLLLEDYEIIDKFEGWVF